MASCGTELSVSARTLVLLAAFQLLSAAAGYLRVQFAIVGLVAGLVAFHRPVWRLLRQHIVLPLQRFCPAEDQQRSGSRQRRVWALTSLTALSLTSIEYFGDRSTFDRFCRQYWAGLTTSRYYTLFGHGYWSLFRLLHYVCLPWPLLRVLRVRLRDCGLALRGIRQHLPLYGIIFLCLLVPLVIASHSSAFQRTYPFYKLAARSWGDFLAWEGFYSLQFIALETFFRGILVQSLSAELGANAVVVVALPYCMIHYNKPLAEVAGAYVAGIVLGALALSTQSIWCGALIHISVAVSMDLLALGQTAGYPGNPQFVHPQ